MKSDRRSHVPFSNHDRRRGIDSRAHRAKVGPLGWCVIALVLIGLGFLLGYSHDKCVEALGENSARCFD